MEALAPAAVDDRREGRDRAITIVFHGLALLANLATGVIVARSLGTAGRGQVAAATTTTQIVAWVFTMGAFHAASYFQAKRPAEARTQLGTWLALTVPLGLLAILVGELLLPAFFAAQTSGARTTARVYMLSAFVLVYADYVYGFVLGAHRFLYYNVVRFAAPAATALTYLVLDLSGTLGVRSALAALAAVNLVAAGTTTAVLARWYGFGRPSLRAARELLSYGVRAHGTNVSWMANARLDVAIMPAFLSAASVGLYSVATNVSWVIVTLAGSLNVLVLPLAARRGARGSRTVIGSLHATLAVALGLAVPLAVLAGPCVRIVYGSGFAGSVPALRILLPGCVLWAGTFVLMAGLYAVNRPLTATLGQASGLVITVAGLLLFLRSGGIEAAALVSTTAYTIVFVLLLYLYRRAAGVTWREFVPGVAPAPAPSR